jgi:hypothetical protein
VKDAKSYFCHASELQCAGLDGNLILASIQWATVVDLAHSREGVQGFDVGLAVGFTLAFIGFLVLFAAAYLALVLSSKPGLAREPVYAGR